MSDAAAVCERLHSDPITVTFLPRILTDSVKLSRFVGLFMHQCMDGGSLFAARVRAAPNTHQCITRVLALVLAPNVCLLLWRLSCRVLVLLLPRLAVLVRRGRQVCEILYLVCLLQVSLVLPHEMVHPLEQYQGSERRRRP